MSAPHPDDEQLSAALDGHDPAALGHAEGCADCAARLDRFRAVAALVAAPVATPSPDAAVAAALRAATVTPLRPRSRRGPFALAAAAMVLVVLAALTVITGGDDDDPGMMAARDESSSALEATAGGADLGDQSDPSALAERLRAVVEPPVVAGDAATASGGAAEGATADAAPQAVVGRRAAAPSGGAGTPCQSTVAQEYGTGLGPLVYTATLRWDGAAAVALVYRIEGATGSLDHRVLVMATADCRLLVAQTF